MSDYQLFEKIEAYLMGQLSVEEAAAFEKTIQKDKKIAARVALQQMEHQAMERMQELDFKQRMATWEESPPPNPEETAQKSVKKRSWLLYLIGIGLIVVLFWGLFEYLNSKANMPTKVETLSNENPIIKPEIEDNQEKDLKIDTLEQEKKKIPIAETIVAPKKKTTKILKPSKTKTSPPIEKANNYQLLALNNYSETVNFAANLRSSPLTVTSEKTNQEKAAVAFEEGHYQEAIDWLGTSTTNEDSRVHYLRGHIYFKLKKFPQAATEFSLVAANDDAPNALEAEWLLLLSHLAQLPNTNNEFQTLVKKMAGDEYSSYQKEAKDLLKKIEEMK